MHITKKITYTACKKPTYGSNYMTFGKRQNYENSKKVSDFQGLFSRRNEQAVYTEFLWDL